MLLVNTDGSAKRVVSVFKVEVRNVENKNGTECRRRMDLVQNSVTVTTVSLWQQL